MRYLWHHSKLPFERHIYNSFLVGAESGLATSTAIIVGLLDPSRSASVIIQASMLVITIQAFNSAMSRYSNLITEEQIDSDRPSKRVAIENGFVQLAAHMASSILLFFAFLTTNIYANLGLVILISLGSLAALGTWKATTLKEPVLKEVMESMLSGGMIIAFGLAIGQFIDSL